MLQETASEKAKNIVYIVLSYMLADCLCGSGNRAVMSLPLMPAVANLLAKQLVVWQLKEHSDESGGRRGVASIKASSSG